MVKKPSPEVWSAIEASTQAFRARGRPLPTDAVDELARAWLAHWRELGESKEVEVTPLAWASHELADLHYPEPRSALAVLGRALELEPGEDAEFLVEEELQGLVQWHPSLVREVLGSFLDTHPGLRARIATHCAEARRPYGWKPELWERLCAAL
jgi:hypothetical protein